jgi:hypothetical protein
MSITQSPRPSASARVAPTRSESGSTQMPALSLARPISVSEQIMPSETSPRIFDFCSLPMPGSVLPGSATATVCPAATLLAPHTIGSGSACPTST